jgi:hypothetical protein
LKWLTRPLKLLEMEQLTVCSLLVLLVCELIADEEVSHIEKVPFDGQMKASITRVSFWLYLLVVDWLFVRVVCSVLLH